MALIDSVIVFLISLAVGGIGIYIGSRIVTGEADYGQAIVTALLGAIIWSIVGFFIGFIPFLGPILTFMAWLAVINSRSEGGWINAAAIALIAWVSVIVVLAVLSALGVTTFEAVGVPGV